MNGRSLFFALFALVTASPVLADRASSDNVDINKNRALFNYQMACQGCHTPDGAGGKAVPDLRNHMGYFLQNSKGREYLVKVPGSASSALSDEHLAEVLNWMLLTYADGSLPENWQPYQVDEVAEYRQEPLYEVVEYRRQLIIELTINDE